MDATRFNLFSEVKFYIKTSQELQAYLAKNPYDWQKFQDTFNGMLDKLYSDMLTFEQESYGRDESQVYKFRRIFEKRYRRYFLYGEFIKWSYEKPFGYAGDFKIIDDIYQNNPRTIGFDRLWDNYFQQLSATKAIRERKEAIKKVISGYIKNNKGRKIRIMNLASGPAREIKDLLVSDLPDTFAQVEFDCYDIDVRSIEYAKKLVNSPHKVNFIQKNAIRLALKNDIRREINSTYDLIYSLGLFDYLDERPASRLVSNLRNILNPDGIMVIANVADKYNNSSSAWMEWVADWNLIYRSKDEFKKIFLDAGFSSAELKLVLQHNKVVQYCFAGHCKSEIYKTIQ